MCDSLALADCPLLYLRCGCGMERRGEERRGKESSDC